MADLKVGDEVERCRTYGWVPRNGRPMILGQDRIVRETKTRWILGFGCQVDKKTLTVIPKYMDYDTFIRPVQTDKA